MILFNLIFSKNLQGPSSGFHLNSKYTVKSFENSYRPLKKKVHLAYIVKSPDILSQSQQKIASRNLLVRNFWQKIFNNFWKQTIFLSVSDKSSDKYNIQLTSLGNYQHKNVKRYLVSKFSKSLFKGSVKSSLIDISSIHSSVLSNVQYTWFKGMNIKHWNLLNSLFYKQSENYSKSVRDYLSRNVSFNHFPLFTISNNLGQMVISEPPEELNIKKSIVDYISFKSNNKYTYEGWFFTNFEDAWEYMQYINEYYGLKHNQLKIFTCNFSAFYAIVRKFDGQVNFRLVPDLKEISELLKKYKYYKNISFHHKQKYGKTYFQGQPLYLFCMTGKNNYNYISRSKQKYNLVFTNYKTALKVWSQVNNKMSSSDFVKMPNVFVYNLECFIKDQVNCIDNLNDSFLLVPSQSSYQFAKEKQLKKNTKIIYETMQSYLSYLQLWSKRVVWSLTSRQPYN